MCIFPPPWCLIPEDMMFDRKGNERYLLVNQQWDVVWMNAYWSTKRRSERVTSAPHYPKICPVDGGGFHQHVRERQEWLPGFNTAALAKQSLPRAWRAQPDRNLLSMSQPRSCWERSLESRETCRTSAGSLGRWPGHGSFGHGNISVSPRLESWRISQLYPCEQRWKCQQSFM